jgi:hypothetical protein
VLPPKKILVLFVGGGVLLAGFYLTLDKLRATLESHLSVRFTQAIAQLASDKPEIRLGGIYALERIARSSEKDYWPIMEILTTFVRERAPARKGQPLKEPHPRLAPDIQAALDVLGRRRQGYKDGERQRLDLRGTDLRRANLAGAKFGGAILSEVHLEGATLTGIHLEEAILRETRLDHATLTEAKLQGASLLNARLDGSTLQAANLREAYAGGARFDEADLRGADLTEVTGLTWEQIKTARKDNRTRLPDYLRLPAQAPGAR